MGLHRILYKAALVGMLWAVGSFLPGCERKGVELVEKNITRVVQDSVAIELYSDKKEYSVGESARVGTSIANLTPEPIRLRTYFSPEFNVFVSRLPDTLRIVGDRDPPVGIFHSSYGVCLDGFEIINNPKGTSGSDCKVSSNPDWVFPLVGRDGKPLDPGEYRLRAIMDINDEELSKVDLTFKIVE